MQKPEAQALEPSASLSMDGVKEAKWDDLWDGWNDNLPDGCRNFGAKALSWDDSRCECPGGTTRFKECDSRGRYFQKDRRLFDRGCRCKPSVEVSRERSTFVRASALRFCTSIVDKAAEARGKLGQLLAKYKDDQHKMGLEEELTREEWDLAQIAETVADPRKYVQTKLGLTENLCKEVLTGRSRNNQEWYTEAAKLSKHQNAMGFGHLDPLVTGSAESHRLLLDKVCTDECEDLVTTTLNNIEKMVKEDVGRKTMPFEQSCADRVVRKVEAEVLGCCGRACNWNGISCMAWPFFTEKEKVNWLDECCTEFNVLDASSRDKMCDSVLSKKQVEKISKFNTKVKEDTDVGGAYIGQDPPLLWAKGGLEKFKGELKGLGPMPKEGDPVSSDFLEKHPDVRTEGLRHKLFKEEKMADDNKKGWLKRLKGWFTSSSFTQIGSSKCENTLKSLKTKMQHCTSQTLMQVRGTCFRQERGWQASVKPEPDDMDPDDMDPTCQEKMIDPRINPPTEVGTPDECFEVKFTDVKDMKRKFFTYNTSDPPDGKFVLEKPILCFSEPEKLRCTKEEDFQGQSVRDIDFKPHKGFADYVYWIYLD